MKYYFLVFVTIAFGPLPILHANDLIVHSIGGRVVRHAPSPLDMAERYGSRGDYVSAILVYDELLSLSPKNTRILKSMVQCYDRMIQKELEEANRRYFLEHQKLLGPQLPNLPENS